MILCKPDPCPERLHDPLDLALEPLEALFSLCNELTHPADQANKLAITAQGLVRQAREMLNKALCVVERDVGEIVLSIDSNRIEYAPLTATLHPSKPTTTIGKTA